MRIIATADLHYDIARSRQPALDIADEICRQQADALLVLGDAAGRDVGSLRDSLRLFDRFAGAKFFVAGNHDLWTDPGGDSLHRLEQELPAVCREVGFHPLDVEPARVGHVGIAGSIGWYDFSYRPEELGIPLRFYEEKIAPGAASRLGGYDHLLADVTDVPPSAFQIGTRWMDGEHIRLPMSDLDFCHRLLGRFEEHLTRLSEECERIVVGLHHLPFPELVPPASKPSWAFASAFLGSPQFGEVIRRFPKIRCVLCGHSHKSDRLHVDHIECINVGCTYREKRYEVIDV